MVIILIIILLFRVNSHDEKKAMNEVFAHAAIMKHKHVVRYYNSWVEKGQVRAIYLLFIFLLLKTGKALISNKKSSIEY